MKTICRTLVLALALQLPAVAQTQIEEETEGKGAENILLPLPVTPGKNATEEEKAAFAEKQKEEFEKVMGAVYESVDKVTGKQIRDAQAIKGQDELLKGINSFSVDVYANDQALKIISKQELKTKVELSLRRNGIKVVDKVGKPLCVFVDALKVNQGLGYSFRSDLKVMEMCYIPRENGYFRFFLFVWSDGGLGVGGVQTAKSSLVENVIDTVEQFSNAYLSQNSDTIESPPAKEKPGAKKSAQKK